MRKKSTSGVLIIREAYLANVSQPIRQRETNDASRTTDEADGLAGRPVGHSHTGAVRELAAVYFVQHASFSATC
jgi:hypothetical protein